MNWIRSGANWMAATWLGDARIIFLLEHNALSLGEYWVVRKKVAGAASPDGYVVGTSDNLDRAKIIAEVEAGQPL